MIFMGRKSAFALCVSFCVGPHLSAQTEMSAPDVVPEPLAVERVHTTKKRKKKTKKQLSFSGRVFARDVLSRADIDGAPWSHVMSVDSARLAAVYKRKWLSMQVEFDVAGGDADLKDGYIRLDPNKSWRVMAGRFKRPMGMMSLTSKWDLPMNERGLLSTLRVGEDRVRLPFSQIRGDGLMVRFKQKISGKKIYVSGGVMQNRLGTDEDLNLGASDVAQDLYGRIALKWNKQIELATSLALFPYLEDLSPYTSDTPGSDVLNHGVVASAEARVQTKNVSVLLSGFTGTNLLAPPSATPLSEGNFVAFQGLLTGHVSRESKPKRIEPFLVFSYFDLSTDAANDALSEWGGGVNLRMVKDLRLTLDYLQSSPQGNNAPDSGRKVVTLQLGGRFKDLGLQ